MSNYGRRRVRETRLYNAPLMRMYNQLPEFHQLQKQVKPHQPNQEKQDQSESFVNNNNRCNDVVMTNLDRFMKHVIPIVTAQHFPKIKIGDILLVSPSATVPGDYAHGTVAGHNREHHPARGTHSAIVTGR
ncbi:hypothetical protein L6452_20886 [Arctium lappa]|uniref:Uncharacterized protein n=1 Tax=Arctium lappa TaxID=4217 RepID=A0ACB9BDG9_ARCLA|nr:hypothetical protein L6452_20886 [Arctium lappa]